MLSQMLNHLNEDATNKKQTMGVYKGLQFRAEIQARELRLKLQANIKILMPELNGISSGMCYI